MILHIFSTAWGAAEALTQFPAPQKKFTTGSAFVDNVEHRFLAASHKINANQAKGLIVTEIHFAETVPQDIREAFLPLIS